MIIVRKLNAAKEIDESQLREWESNGYKRIFPLEPLKENPLDEMTVEELTEYAQRNNIDIGKATTEKAILEKIKAAQVM